MTTDYVTEQEFLDYYKSNADPGNEVTQTAISAASRAVDAYCARFFYQVDQTAYYSGDTGNFSAYWYLAIDDLATTTGLTVHVDTNLDGTYSTLLTLNTDFILEPINQQVGGIQGWPYSALRSKVPFLFPIRYFSWQPETVKIAATWGWPAVPNPVKQATKIIAAQLVKLADAPFGVAGWGAYGDIRVREIPQASVLLEPYRQSGSYGIA